MKEQSEITKTLTTPREIARAYRTARYLCQPICREIVRLIQEHSRLTVSEIQVRLQKEQSVVSRALIFMRNTGFLESNRYGKYMYYTLAKEKIERVNQHTKQVGDYSPLKGRAALAHYNG